jgi:alcohol dehydrogenase
MQMPLPMFPFRAIAIQGSMVGSLSDTLEMMALVREGKVDPVPVSKRPLSAANQTLEDLREGRIVGRVVLTP